MRYNRNQRATMLLAVLIFCVMSFFGSAEAMNFKLGQDTSIDCDVTVTYGAGWRVSDREDRLRYNPTNPNPLANGLNADDGNENFDQWSMINNKISLLADIDVQHKNVGLFLRPKAFYDHVYMSDNDNNSPLTNNAFMSGLIDDADEWADEVEDVHGKDAEILDLFAYGSFNLGGRNLEVRVGRQTIQWGESLYIFGMTTRMAHVDVAAASAVGTEVKEILLPTESVYVQFDLTRDLAVNTYYQWKWNHYKFYEGGSFFSDRDPLDELKADVLLAPVAGAPTLARGRDADAKDDGQFGVSLTYMWEALNSTEFGLYYINYHQKTPLLAANATNYWLVYPENVNLFGASYSTQIGDTNVSGEIAYHRNYTFDFGVKANWWQAQTSWFHLMSADPVADSLTFLGEVACAKAVGLPDSYLVGGNAADDSFAWRYVLSLSFDWYQVFQDLDMGLNMRYQDGPSGTNVAFSEGDATGSIGVDFTYKVVWKGDITYENEFNARRNSVADRDTVSLTLSYTF